MIEVDEFGLTNKEREKNRLIHDSGSVVQPF